MKVIERKEEMGEMREMTEMIDLKRLLRTMGSRWSKQPLVEKFHEIPKEKKKEKRKS